MCAPLCLSVRDRALLLQLGISFDVIPESEEVIAGGEGGVSSLSGGLRERVGWGEAPILSFAASPKW